jgi:hypothetical protein
MMISDNVTLRHSAEDQLARDLIKTGVSATPAYAVFGDGANQAEDVDALKAQLAQRGFDGIVTMRIVDREQRLDSVPATFDAYWGYWGPGYYGGYYWPGYAYTETIYRIESAAYSLRSGQLLWSALTKTVDPSSSREMVDTTTSIVAEQLTKRGLAG